MFWGLLLLTLAASLLEVTGQLLFCSEKHFGVCQMPGEECVPKEYGAEGYECRERCRNDYYGWCPDGETCRWSHVMENVIHYCSKVVWA